MTLRNILAVYRASPVMLVVEAADGSILELFLNELAEAYEFLPPLLWQELVHYDHIFHVK